MAKLRSIAFNVPLAIFVIFSLFLFYFYLPGIYKAQSSNNALVEEARKDVFLVAMVVSDAKEAVDRQLIRDSWFKFRDNRIAKLFVVANVTDTKVLAALNKERNTYKDLVILDNVHESENRYQALRMLRALKYTYDTYKFSYVLKVDKQSFVLLPKLLEYLTNIPLNKRAYIGVLNGAAFKDDFYGEGYVNYMLAPGYVLGSDLVGYIGRSQHLMRYYDWEDVTIGAHLGFIKDITFMDEEDKFAAFKTNYYCFKDALVTARAGENMQEMYTAYKTFGNQCSIVNKEL